MSYAEDMGYDAFDPSDVPEYNNNEEHWQNGIHYDANDNQIKLSDMTQTHLLACISKWPEKDTSPLQKELNKRLKCS